MTAPFFDRRAGRHPGSAALRRCRRRLSQGANEGSREKRANERREGGKGIGCLSNFGERYLLLYDGVVSNYGDGTQGKHELQTGRDGLAGGLTGDSQGLTGDSRIDVGDGPELYQGLRAGVLIDQGGVTVFDTQGIDRFNLRTEAPVCVACGKPGNCGCPMAEKAREAYLRWERMHCSDCGTRVWEGAMFCRECRPYGFWHWLVYFSPMAWRRIRADRSIEEVKVSKIDAEKLTAKIVDGRNVL